MIFRRTAIFVLFLFTATFSVMAQTSPGEVQIYVFSPEGMPLEGISVDASGGLYRSDGNGLINFVHPAGTFTFTLRQEGRPVAIVELPVNSGELTEAIVTASDNPVVQERRELREEIETEERAALDTAGPSGLLVGRITSLETEEPIAEATVIFRGVDYETTTDADGEFTAELPAGSYSFSVIHPDYSSQTQDGVEVTADTEQEVVVQLTPSAIELDEVAVFASEEVIVQGGIANLIDETRNSAVVLNLIGAEQISRTGDSDAAGALSRVTGLTVLDGGFVYVRGMGERYSSSLLNGARLPSPEPDRRVVPLDLFPTSVIESISVQKSYSPELPADFGGGAISIRTAGIPDDRYARRLRTQVSASLGYNTQSTFTEQLVNQRAPTDFLGIDLGERQLPDEIESAPAPISEFDALFNPSGLTPDEITELGQSFENRWQPEERTIPLDYGVSASVRDKIEFENGGNFGFNAAALYSNSWTNEQGNRNAYTTASNESGVAAETAYSTESTVNDIDLGTIIDLVWEPARGKSFESTTLLVRTTSDSYRTLEGVYGPEGSLEVLLSEAIWTEDMLFSQGLGTELETDIFNGAVFDASYVYSLAQRYQPDAIYAWYDETSAGEFGDGQVDEEFRNLSQRRTDDQKRVWTTVRDNIHDGSVNVELPLTLFGRPSPDYLDLGLYGMYQDRETDIRRFAFQPQGSNPLFAEDLGTVFDPANIGDEIEFSETTEQADNYTGQHTIAAGYAAVDALVFAGIRMNAGARFEYSRQAVQAFNTDNEEENAVLETADILPAINFTVPIFDASQIRLGGSRTVNRPDLRELSSAPFYGPPGFGEVQGNPNVGRAQIWNADLRFEKYISMNESVSLGVFYKYFEDPIETIQLQSSSFIRVPVNIASATNFGVELEWALQFRFVSDGLRNLMLSLDFDSAERERRWRRRLGGVASVFRDLRTTGNVALIRSDVDYGGSGISYEGASVANTSSSRPLQGQAPYVINAALGYRNSVSWSQDRPMYTSVFLNYNVVGPFIFQPGVEGVDDYYQQSFHQMDLVLRQQFGHVVSMSVEFGNILNPLATQTVGEDRDGEIIEEARRGRTVSISVSLDL